MFDPATRAPGKAGREQLLGTVPILEVGGQHPDLQEESQRIHQDMPLAPVDLLARGGATLADGYGWPPTDR